MVYFDPGAWYDFSDGCSRITWFKENWRTGVRAPKFKIYFLNFCSQDCAHSSGPLQRALIYGCPLPSESVRGYVLSDKQDSVRGQSYSFLLESSDFKFNPISSGYSVTSTIEPIRAWGRSLIRSTGITIFFLLKVTVAFSWSLALRRTFTSIL